MKVQGIEENFLLSTETAIEVYESVKDLPIIDYHNHLSISDIAKNRRFTDVYELWIKPDPYKHRAMRMCGVPEKYITGSATNEEKFEKWWETLPKLLMNPLSHWSAMELKVFDIEGPLDGKNAKSIYERCNDYLKKNELTVDRLLNLFNVEYACPCASLIDDVEAFGKDGRFAPSLRGDDIVAPTKRFVESLGCITGEKIDTLSDFEKAVEKRLQDFKKVGCCFSDHALDNGFIFHKDDGKNGERFQRLLKDDLDKEDKDRLFSYVLTFLGKQYAEKGFVMQLHIGAQRYTSAKLRAAVGPAGGFAGIGNSVNVSALTEFLNEIDQTEHGLPKIVLFTLNPADNALISVLSGSFSKDGESGLITQGPAWWWCDHKFGMEEMLENTSAFGVLSNFIGMTTDSRSFLSFVRHDYFRRVLCDWLGNKWKKGELLCDIEKLKELAKMLCYQNAKITVSTKPKNIKND